MTKLSQDCFHTRTRCSRQHESVLLGYGYWSLMFGSEGCAFCTDNFLEFSQETETVALTQRLHPAIWSHDEQTPRIPVEAPLRRKIGLDRQPSLGPSLQADSMTKVPKKRERDSAWGY